MWVTLMRGIWLLLWPQGQRLKRYLGWKPDDKQIWYVDGSSEWAMGMVLPESVSVSQILFAILEKYTEVSWGYPIYYRYRESKTVDMNMCVCELTCLYFSPIDSVVNS